MNYEQSKIAQSELLYITGKIGEPPKFLELEGVVELLKKHDIQLGPNELVVGMAFSLGKIVQKNENV